MKLNKPKTETLADQLCRRGVILHNQRRYDEAITLFEKAIRLDPGHADAIVSRGLAYFRKGDYQRALDDAAHCLRLQPGHPGGEVLSNWAREQLSEEEP